MATDNLFEMLYASPAEQAELEQTLLDYFHSASSVSVDEIVYPGNAAEYALKLSYEDGTLVAISPGPKLTSNDVEALREKIAREILNSEGAGVGRYVLFSSVPVTGLLSLRRSLPDPASAT